MKIIWNPLALLSYNQIVGYLSNEWNRNVVNEFRHQVENILNIIKENPYAFKRSSRYRNVRKVIITTHNTLYYKVKTNEIELLIFWDNRQDSKKLKY